MTPIYRVDDLFDKLVGRDPSDRIHILYEWTKTGYISLYEFRVLLEKLHEPREILGRPRQSV